MGNSDSTEAEAESLEINLGADRRGSDSSLEEEKFKEVMARQSSGRANDHYACMHFRRHDQVYIIWGDVEFRSISRKVLDGHLGVAKVQEYKGELVYLKMSGWPFQVCKVGTKEAILLRKGAAELLRQLYTVGWVLIGTSGLTRKNHVSSWFFQRVPVSQSAFGVGQSAFGGGQSAFGAVSEQCLKENSVLVVNVSSSDKIQLLNAPLGLVEALTQEVVDNYSKGIQGVEDEGECCRTIRLHGYPWSFSGETKTEGVLLMTRILARIEQSGYALYGTGDMKGTSDSIFFMPTAKTNIQPFSSYVVLTLDSNDDLRIQNAEQFIIDEISQKILQTWPQGIQREGEFRDGHEWKLSGRPWWARGETAIQARQMLVAVFNIMSNRGYEHYATLDLSRKLNDKSTIIFRRNPEGPKMDFAAVSPSNNDRLRLIDFPADSPLHRGVQNAVVTYWPSGTQEVKQLNGMTEVRMKGTPFDNIFSWKSETHARAVMSGVLAELHSAGWRLVSSCDVSAKFYADRYAQYPLDLDCWFVGKPKEAGPDAPPPYADAPPAYDEAAAGAYSDLLADLYFPRGLEHEF